MNLLREVYHLFFPKKCVCCSSSLMKMEKQICASCIAFLPKTSLSLSLHSATAKLLIGKCDFQGASSLYYFDKKGKIQHAIHELKYQKNRYLGFFLGELMGLNFKNELIDKKIDAIIPVPLHPIKEKQRGYNQATILAKGMAHASKIPYWNDILVRGVNTTSQTAKNKQERWNNVKSAFKLQSPMRLDGKNILILDDVITSGATIEACILKLREANVKNLYVMTLALPTI